MMSEKELGALQADVATIQSEVKEIRAAYKHPLSTMVATHEMRINRVESASHLCLKEQDWGRLWEIIKEHAQHVIDGDKEGGFRDRLFKAEIDLKALKEKFWQSSLIGAIIGTLIGAGCKDAINSLFFWITKR